VPFGLGVLLSCVCFHCYCSMSAYSVFMRGVLNKINKNKNV